MDHHRTRSKKSAPPAIKVADVMERDLTSVSDSTTLEQAMLLFAAHRTSGLPVLDDSGDVVGFISEKDILKAMIPGYIGYMDENFALPSIAKIKSNIRSIGSSPVSEFMTKTPILFNEDDDLSSAFVAIFKMNIHRAPVVNNGHLAGIISRESVLRHFVRADISDGEDQI